MSQCPTKPCARQHLDPPILPRLNEETIELRGDAARHRGIGSSGVSRARVQGECEGIVVRHHTHHDLRGWGTDNTRLVHRLKWGTAKPMAFHQLTLNTKSISHLY